MSWLDDLFRRGSISPFAGPPKLIYHGAHHKMGTVWLMRVLEKVASVFKLEMQKSNSVDESIDSGAQIFFSNHSQHWDAFCEIAPDRVVGSHMIRDPRDAIVSGYFYHLWTDEKWAHLAREDFGGKSYQQHLRSLAQDEGLEVEIQSFSHYVNDYKMRTWDYDNELMLELRYEELIENESDQFEKLFQHYGFSESSLDKCVEIAATQSFKNVTKRNPGEPNAKNHLRSGKPGEWHSVLKPQHVDLIDELFGDLISLMGY
jgi:hypothetical protein